MRNGLALIGVLLVTVWLYAPVRTAGYVWEDAQTLPSASTTLQAPRLEDLVRGRYLTYASFGLVGPNVEAQHLVNLGLHLACGAALFAVALAVPLPLGWAAFASALFLWAPLQIGTVAYVVQRSELLGTLPVLLAVWLALRPLTARSLAALAGCLFLACLAKESFVVGIGLVGLLLVWRGRVSLPRWGVWLAAGFGLWLLAHVVSVLMDPSWGLVSPRHGLGYLAVQTAAAWHLFGSLLWPSGLSVDPDWSFIGRGEAYPVLAWTVGGLVWAAWLRRRDPDLSWVLLWPVVCLLPRGFLRSSEFLTTHHLYLALAGVAVLLGLVGSRAWALSAPRLEAQS